MVTGQLLRRNIVGLPPRLPAGPLSIDVLVLAHTGSEELIVKFLGTLKDSC